MKKLQSLQKDLWEEWIFDNFRGTKKKHQPRVVDARPVLPPCTSRGSKLNYTD